MVKDRLLKSWGQVVEQARGSSYDIFGRQIIFYPPETSSDSPVLIVQALYQEIPLEAINYESRVISQQNHLSIQMSELLGIRNFSGWQVVGVTQMDEVYVGVVDAVMIDNTLDIVNITFKRQKLRSTTEDMNPEGGYLS